MRFALQFDVIKIQTLLSHKKRGYFMIQGKQLIIKLMQFDVGSSFTLKYRFSINSTDSDYSYFTTPNCFKTII